MKRIFFAAAFANFALVALSVFVLPARAAIHFGVGGEPDGWASPAFHAVLFLAVSAMLLAAIRGASLLVEKLPPHLINLPNREYWLRPENTARTVSMLSREMEAFGAIVFVFLFVAQGLAIQANLADPVRLNESALLAALGLLLVACAAWVFGLYRAFRIPGPAPE